MRFPQALLMLLFELRDLSREIPLRFGCSERR